MGALYRRIKTRMERVMEVAEKAADAGDFRGAAALLRVAHQHDETLLKLGERPGYRDQPPPTQINAPDARIVVTPALPRFEG